MSTRLPVPGFTARVTYTDTDHPVTDITTVRHGVYAAFGVDPALVEAEANDEYDTERGWWVIPVSIAECYELEDWHTLTRDVLVSRTWITFRIET